MPELPDITVYLDALERHVAGHVLLRVDIASPFVLRSFDPPLSSAFGLTVRGLRRLGKRIVFALDQELFLVIHLMIAGRLQWQDAAPKRNRIHLAVFHFDNGALILTEAGSKRRASLHLVKGEDALAAHDRGGLEVMDSTSAAFAARLTSENHTLKRALTDPRLFSGIGNAYSDEILHRARLSPLMLTSRLTTEQIATLHAAVQAVMAEWIARFREEAKGGFPKKVTAFRPEMATHGKFRQACPVCGTPIQRIRYAENETNYCATCQTGGKLLADRGMSRLLKDDWPRSLDEMEADLEQKRNA